MRSPTIFNSLKQITATPETSSECRKWRSSSTTWESWGRGTVPSNKVSMNWKTGSRQLSTGASLTTRGRLLVRKPMTWSKMSPSRSRCHWLLALISHGLRRINSLNRMKECSKTCSVNWYTKRPTCLFLRGELQSWNQERLVTTYSSKEIDLENSFKKTFLIGMPSSKADWFKIKRWMYSYASMADRSKWWLTMVLKIWINLC